MLVLWLLGSACLPGGKGWLAPQAAAGQGVCAGMLAGHVARRCAVPAGGSPECSSSGM